MTLVPVGRGRKKSEPEEHEPGGMAGAPAGTRCRIIRALFDCKSLLILNETERDMLLLTLTRTLRVKMQIGGEE